MSCPICLEAVDQASDTKTRCGHYFHSECIEKWVGNTCPVCRAVLDETKPVVSPYDHSAEDRQAIMEAVEDELALMLQEELLLALVQDILGVDIFPIGFVNVQPGSGVGSGPRR